MTTPQNTGTAARAAPDAHGVVAAFVDRLQTGFEAVLGKRRHQEPCEVLFFSGRAGNLNDPFRQVEHQ